MATYILFILLLVVPGLLCRHHHDKDGDRRKENYGNHDDDDNSDEQYEQCPVTADDNGMTRGFISCQYGCCGTSVEQACCEYPPADESTDNNQSPGLVVAISVFTVLIVLLTLGACGFCIHRHVKAKHYRAAPIMLGNRNNVPITTVQRLTRQSVVKLPPYSPPTHSLPKTPTLKPDFKPLDVSALPVSPPPTYQSSNGNQLPSLPPEYSRHYAPEVPNSYGLPPSYSEAIRPISSGPGSRGTVHSPRSRFSNI